MTVTKNSNFPKEIYYDSKSELEIIKRFQDLILYVYTLLKKYPENEILNLSSDTKKVLIDSLENLIYAKKTYQKTEKLKYLIGAEVNLNVLSILVRIAVKNKYINKRNYTSWSFKISEMNNMLGKWMRSCQR